MIITKKALPRRTILRSFGAALALPLLDAMTPALTAAATPVKRFNIVYVPNGIVMENWTPKEVGTEYELTRSLQPLATFKNDMIVLTGLHNKGVDQVHDAAAPAFLTSSPPRRTQGSDLHAGVSIDQVAARHFGAETQLASLELTLEFNDDAGTCGAGYTCAYTNTISWRDAMTPLPMESNPRVLFERLLGDGGGTSQAARLQRIKSDRSLLDSLIEKVARLRTNLGARDREKLEQYLEAVRDVERRIQKAEAQVDQDLPQIAPPLGIPVQFEDHAKLMYDLQLVAFQADLTRVITFMVSREYSGRTYPQIGVPDAHHPISHHQGDKAKIESLTKINAYHTSLFAYYLDRLKQTKDGDGCLLDHMIILYGGALSDGNRHSTQNLPLLLLGGGAGELKGKGGRHMRYAEEPRMSNLHVALLNKLGVPTKQFGEPFLTSTEELSI